MLSQPPKESSYIPDPFVKEIERKLYICFQAIDNIIREGKNHIPECLIKEPTLINASNHACYERLNEKINCWLIFMKISINCDEAYCLENHLKEPTKIHSPGISYINLRKKIFQNTLLADQDVSDYLFNNKNKETHFISIMWYYFFLRLLNIPMNRPY